MKIKKHSRALTFLFPQTPHLMSKPFRWKKFILRSLLVLLLGVIVFVVNLIWFKPFSIRLFYDKVFVEYALSDPEMVTQLGVPVLYGMTKDELTDVSDNNLHATFDHFKEALATLKSYPYESQSPANQLNTRILEWYLTTMAESEPYFYHDYPVNQMFGAQNNLPSFMESAHQLHDKSDAEAYITRLSKFDTKFEQVLEGLKIRESKGIIPPRFVIDRVLNEMKGFTGQQQNTIDLETKDPNPIHTNILFTNFKSKIDTLKSFTDAEKKELTGKVENEMSTTVFPAYQKLIDYFTALREKATDDDGVWKFPDGDNFYRYQLKYHTTVSLDPETIHHIGVSEVARIKKEMWDILKSQGYTDTTKNISDVISSINKEERFLFPNDDHGRKLALAEYNRILDDISNHLDSAFDVRPKAKLEVQRVPAFKEEGSPGAYYNGPPMDQSRGGVFYVNLRDLHEIVKFGMKTLAYHEGIPGHHFQIAIQSEIESVPVFRNVLGFTAYAEGWALYSEQLAWELGFYKNDPFGNLGRLQAEMFRSVRLVVDTGIHHKRWSRQQAIDYMVANTGMPVTEVTTEIERYIVMPGQACAYKIGMLKILELREKAKTALGSKFDLREFHNVVLKNGSVPLEVLEQIVDEYIANTKPS